nr:MAG TPA: hypothetical protein [Caudoviricetes sp.]
MCIHIRIWRGLEREFLNQMSFVLHNRVYQFHHRPRYTRTDETRTRKACASCSLINIVYNCCMTS